MRGQVAHLCLFDPYFFSFRCHSDARAKRARRNLLSLFTCHSERARAQASAKPALSAVEGSKNPYRIPTIAGEGAPSKLRLGGDFQFTSHRKTAWRQAPHPCRAFWRQSPPFAKSRRKGWATCKIYREKKFFRTGWEAGDHGIANISGLGVSYSPLLRSWRGIRRGGTFCSKDGS